MTGEQLINQYEEQFGESLTIPFFMPNNKTEKDFFAQVEKCIKENKPFDYKKFGFSCAKNAKI